MSKKHMVGREEPQAVHSPSSTPDTPAPKWRHGQLNQEVLGNLQRYSSCAVQNPAPGLRLPAESREACLVSVTNNACFLNPHLHDSYRDKREIAYTGKRTQQGRAFITMADTESDAQGPQG